MRSNWRCVEPTVETHLLKELYHAIDFIRFVCFGGSPFHAVAPDVGTREFDGVPTAMNPTTPGALVLHGGGKVLVLQHNLTVGLTCFEVAGVLVARLEALRRA